jgi:flagellar biogenesis protein FliO
VTSALSTYLLESALVLVAVAGLAWFVSFLARRAGVARGASALELLARLPLDARRSVYVVRVLDQVLILGASETGLAKLGELPEQAIAEFRKAPAALGWAALLGGSPSREASLYPKRSPSEGKGAP